MDQDNKDLNQKPARNGVTPTLKAFGLAVLIVGGLWLGVAGVPSMLLSQRQSLPSGVTHQPNDPNTHHYDPARPAQSITYQRTALMPMGQPQTLPGDEMVYLGLSQEGYAIWSQQIDGNTRARAGGGGGPQAPRALPQAIGPVFLKTKDGRFVQLQAP